MENVIERIDPQLRAAAEKIESAVAGIVWSDQTLPAIRAMLAAMNPAEPLPDVMVEERMVPVGGDNPDVKIFIINAADGQKRPGILHSHGGGTIAGSAYLSVPRLQKLARDEGWVIVTVEYRLSPETPYKGVIEDHYAALRWMHANASELGLNPDKIAVMGESAGGGNAARLALTARDRKEVPLAAQILIYPMLDDRTGSTVKVPDFIGAILWTPQANQYGWSSFLGMPAGSDDAPPEAVPSRQTDLSGLPPTFIGVGALDLFVFEDTEYARRLIEAGVPTKLLVSPGAYHGFDQLAPDADISKEFAAVQMSALRSAFK